MTGVGVIGVHEGGVGVGSILDWKFSLLSVKSSTTFSLR